MIRTILVTPLHMRSVEAARAERQGNLDNWAVGFEGN
jgi:hypothetical protein